MKITWEIRKVRRTKLPPSEKGLAVFQVYVKANVGHDEMWEFDAYDELDAWREAEKYAKENYI
jgi:hypothetical protein